MSYPRRPTSFFIDRGRIRTARLVVLALATALFSAAAYARGETLLHPSTLGADDLTEVTVCSHDTSVVASHVARP